MSQPRATPKRKPTPTLRTVSNIEVLLHCHVSPEPHPRLNAPAVQEGLELLLHHKLIEHAGYGVNVFMTTSKGKALVERLKSVSLEVAV